MHKEEIVLEPRIETLEEEKLVGKRIRISFSDYKTSDLWRTFMPRRKEIKNTVGSDLFSVEVYPEGFFDKLDSKADFEKWAAIEVADFYPYQMKWTP